MEDEIPRDPSKAWGVYREVDGFYYYYSSLGFASGPYETEDGALDGLDDYEKLYDAVN